MFNNLATQQNNMNNLHNAQGPFYSSLVSTCNKGFFNKNLLNNNQGAVIFLVDATARNLRVLLPLLNSSA